MRAFRARRPPTGCVTVTDRGSGGRWVQCDQSWPTPATPVGQVWNRQRTDYDLLDPTNTGLGHRDVLRWNPPEDWVISTAPAHAALVSEADFVAVQHLRAAREASPPRSYLLAGMLLRPVQPPDGILLERPGGLPVPARPLQRNPAEPGSAA